MLITRSSTSRILLTALIIFVIPANIYSQTEPESEDYLLAALGMGVAVGLELFAKDHLIPDEPRFTEPNQFDRSLRTQLFWGQESQQKAIAWSDRLLYGVSFSSLAWGPLMDEHKERALLINAEVFAANAIVTNLVKILTARERPYHHYGTMSSQGSDDFASFFSGHTSVAFSQAVTNAMILSESDEKANPYIWATLLGSAGLTGYFRIAGDKHYTTDVIVGALVGSIIGWTITNYELDRLSGESESNAQFMLSMKIPLG